MTPCEGCSVAVSRGDFSIRVLSPFVLPGCPNEPACLGRKSGDCRANETAGSVVGEGRCDWQETLQIAAKTCMLTEHKKHYRTLLRPAKGPGHCQKTAQKDTA
jgi:hypothetical protein